MDGTAAANRAIMFVDKTEINVIVKSVVDKVLGRIQQSLVGTINDKAQNALAIVGNDLVKHLFEHCQNWFSAHDGSVPVLPDGTKYYSKIDENRTIIVVEEKPSVRSFCFHAGTIDLGEVIGKISLPYLVFTMVFYGNKLALCYVHYRNEPLRNLDDMLYHANLTNLYDGNGQVCFGDALAYGRSLRSNHIVDLVPEVLGIFWQSRWTKSDYAQNHKAMALREPKLRTIAEWIKNSTDDPAFILKVQWRPFQSLKKLIDQLSRGVSPVEAGLSANIQTELQASINNVTKQLASWMEESTVLVKADERSVSVAFANEFQKVLESACYATLKDCVSLLSDEIKNMAAAGLYSDNAARPRSYRDRDGWNYDPFK